MKMPFGKNEHINVIKSIAVGLHAAGFLTRYLELGIRRGPCFNAVAPLCNEAYAVDINDCYKLIKRNKNLVWFHGTTTNFLTNHDKEKKFDLVFIDADHNHKASLNDFKLVLPLVNDNGIILLHDTYPTCKELLSSHYCSDTYKTAEYIRKNFSSECEIVTLPFYFGVSVVRKLNRQLVWKYRGVEHREELYDFLYDKVRDKLVFDIGANVGRITKKFIDVGAKVVAVEPQSGLTKGPNFSKALAVENICVSDTTGETVFYRCSSPNKSSCNFHWRKLFSSVRWRERRLPTMTLDNLIEKYGIPIYIKIDVEGFEDYVLGGLSHKIKFISFEYTPEFREEFMRCIDHIKRLGFSELVAYEKKKRTTIVDKFDDIDELVDYFDNFPKGSQGDLLVTNE